MNLRSGKLPEHLLAELLARVPHRDARVVAGPGIGRDAAVIDLGGGQMLVAKTDPVTFAGDEIGWYAVHVNANDIACMGARPAWFLATMLLPVGVDDGVPTRILDEMVRACDALGIELVGGHTEVTAAVDRPVIAGAMLGEASREQIVAGENIGAGDIVLLTKSVAIEGTALLAREARDALIAAGAGDGEIDAAAALLFEPGISVVPDAIALSEVAKPRLMHDPTEGGVATALREMAAAAGREIEVDVGAIPVHPATRAVCDALALDPLGLLASGALLAIVAADAVQSAIDRLGRDGIPCAVIGRVGPATGSGILGAGMNVTPLPAFDRDELARFFDAARGTS